jgi:MFS family permease
MTGLQALVAVALFAPGVVAPRLSLAEHEISIFTTAVFAVGAATSLYGGMLAARLGPFFVAALCAVAVSGAMLLAGLATVPALICAGMLLGLAFGPETPASSTLLAKLATPRERPLVFSVRQTGNQLGAMLGSLSLPLIALYSPFACFVIISALGIFAALVFLRLRPTYDPVAKGTGARIDLKTAMRLVSAEPLLVRLALASMPLSAMQMALNTFFVTHAVDNLGASHVVAGILLSLGQAGGLIGRLSWGYVATRYGSARAVLIGLGAAMSVMAFTLAAAGPRWPIAALAGIVFLLGLTASGWNGVLLAEVSRLAPAQRVAEATGAVLMASYTGLLIGPSVVAAFAAVGTLSLSYAVLGAGTLVATLGLAWRAR